MLVPEKVDWQTAAAESSSPSLVPAVCARLRKRVACMLAGAQWLSNDARLALDTLANGGGDLRIKANGLNASCGENSTLRQ